MRLAQCFLLISQEQLMLNAWHSSADKALVEGSKGNGNLSLLNDLTISVDVPLLELINRTDDYVEFNSMKYTATDDGVADTVWAAIQAVNRRLSRHRHVHLINGAVNKIVLVVPLDLYCLSIPRLVAVLVSNNDNDRMLLSTKHYCNLKPSALHECASLR